MNTTLTLVDLGGAIALLIWGVHMVQTGITRAFGPQLRRMLSYALGNRFKAFVAGVGVTSILQSSTATGLMVTAFAAGGLVDLVPALAVMLGANVGTTLIVQVLSFNVSRVSFLLILIGVFMFRRSGVTRMFRRMENSPGSGEPIRHQLWWRLSRESKRLDRRQLAERCFLPRPAPGTIGLGDSEVVRQ